MSDDDTTRIIPRKNAPADETRPIGVNSFKSSDSNAEPLTRIYRPKATTATSPSATPVETPVSDFSSEPVVGWLVVIDGPGRGQSLKLGYGVNTIGRGSDCRVSLDFGDEQVSRQGHAMLTYDTKGRRFYIQHGGAANLTYLGDEPVLQPHEIKGREVIGIGNTKLIFVPFCGPEFEW